MKRLKSSRPRNREYEVGYGRPPKATRFKKGQSGNVTGRKKREKLMCEILADTLNERVVVNDGGTSRSISKKEAWAKQFVNKAALGDPRYVRLLADLMPDLDSFIRDARLVVAAAEQSTARERVTQKLNLIAESAARAGRKVTSDIRICIMSGYGTS
jgi:hypothetical protein